jgi:hypothetical protein
MGEARTLSYGAKGIEVGDFVLQQGKDKIVLLAKSSDEHYTFQVGTRSGIMDLHRTWRDQNGATHHDTLFAIHHEQLPELLTSVATAPCEFFRLLRPLRVEWLARHGIGIVHGLDPVTDEQIAAITRRRKRRLVLDEQRLQAAVTIPEYLDGVYEFPDGLFSLFRGRTKIGVGIKETDQHGQTRLSCVRLRDLRRLANTWEQRLTQAAVQHAIPASDYPRYPFLQATSETGEQ